MKKHWAITILKCSHCDEKILIVVKTFSYRHENA